MPARSSCSSRTSGRGAALSRAGGPWVRRAGRRMRFWLATLTPAIRRRFGSTFQRSKKRFPLSMSAASSTRPSGHASADAPTCRRCKAAASTTPGGSPTRSSSSTSPRPPKSASRSRGTVGATLYRSVSSSRRTPGARVSAPPSSRRSQTPTSDTLPRPSSSGTRSRSTSTSPPGSTQSFPSRQKRPAEAPSPSRQSRRSRTSSSTTPKSSPTRRPRRRWGKRT
mmetsp:Transcript_14611/g.48990  ORF Transcript_14611/g.48990 Transcript_14611/m.48990 type:complete len:224 (-) Transcript_14611:213-884(-)